MFFIARNYSNFIVYIALTWQFLNAENVTFLKVKIEILLSSFRILTLDV